MSEKERTNNNLQNTKDWATRPPLKTEGVPEGLAAPPVVLPLNDTNII
jgi:hypothetical protein